MASPPALKEAIISSSLVMPELVDFVANVVGVWPLIVLYLKETGRVDDGDSLVVWFLSSEFYCHRFVPMYIVFFWCLEEGNGWVLLSRPARLFEFPHFPHAA